MLKSIFNSTLNKRPSSVLKSLFLKIIPLSKGMKKSKGLLSELQLSKSFHEQSLPILISPKILRERGIGQIDLASYDKKNKKIILIEVKSSALGIAAMQKFQFQRLVSAQVFLGQLFGVVVSLKKQKLE